MNVLPRLEQLSPKKLVGKRARMSFAANTTVDLWKSFMPRRKEVANAAGPELYSVEVYPPHFFSPFDPAAAFEKWAGVAVAEGAAVPEGMEALDLPAGLYAVFVYQGTDAAAADFYRYIFTGWLPSSGYELDDRPHFALMGAKYKRESPDSEEEIWIPVRGLGPEAVP
ncbi:GyrI-like domain-containing protein [Paraflavisolibacter sp. H34]|uniref:GyrI-like domain-containing protein n=1 Tax=Huijunlia imazamoxiresistens TaxID=3127457 RepID=UPI00301761C1